MPATQTRNPVLKSGEALQAWPVPVIILDIIATINSNSPSFLGVFGLFVPRGNLFKYLIRPKSYFKLKIGFFEVPPKYTYEWGNVSGLLRGAQKR